MSLPYFCFLKCGHAALAHLYAPGVVDEDIDAPKGIDCGLDNPLAILNRVVVGDRFAACGLDLIDDLVGSLSVWLVAAL
jgi:hypothetical protein